MSIVQRVPATCADPHGEETHLQMREKEKDLSRQDLMRKSDKIYYGTIAYTVTAAGTRP
jgi:hypothetical protein